MRNIFLILLITLIVSCQREKRNELGVEYNKTLIIPPNNDLPLPKPKNNKIQNTLELDNNVVNSIIEQPNLQNLDPSIVDKIDEESGYNSDENFLQWLFKGKSKR